ncbi:DUF3341 domain-containing protein [Nitrosococcus wardiae]|uniref:DUF3341 domain-containing protein n=1 Tax=Nitrosococcus wardiae TaxID=1814290 RepID=A0A4P7BZP6_9GAMM|nr:DUF3341 domain-containing protein [Nitrosococcus wardiae]QBQ54837.1 DUF3341 domain-containing protein [Nitrosococcus wardiae]
MNKKPVIYGFMAEFRTANHLLEAAKRARKENYRKVDAYTPFPVEGLSEALGFRSNKIALITLIGGLIGGIGGYFLQYYSAVIDYPFNTGGRPYHSWPVFIIPTFELTILCAALAAFFSMLLLNGLPKLYHPVFNVKDFDLATRNRFFLCILSSDPLFDDFRTWQFLEELNPLHIHKVAA